MHEPRKIPGVVTAVALVAALVSATTPLALAQSDCAAEVDVELVHEEKGEQTTHLQFQAEVSYTEGDCAMVHYDLVLELLLSNGQVKRVRKPRNVRITNEQSETEMIRHEMSSDLALRDYEAKIVSCDPCATP